MAIIDHCARCRENLNRNPYYSWSHSNHSDSMKWNEMKGRRWVGDGVGGPDLVWVMILFLFISLWFDCVYSLLVCPIFVFILLRIVCFSLTHQRMESMTDLTVFLLEMDTLGLLCIVIYCASNDYSDKLWSRNRIVTIHCWLVWWRNSQWCGKWVSADHQPHSVDLQISVNHSWGIWSKRGILRKR